jgi:hypothetical protein
MLPLTLASSLWQHRILVRVETSDASHSPLQAVDRAFDSLITEFSQIDQRFKVTFVALSLIVDLI